MHYSLLLEEYTFLDPIILKVIETIFFQKLPRKHLRGHNAFFMLYIKQGSCE